MNSWYIRPASGNINTHLVSYSSPNILSTIDEALQRLRALFTTPKERSPFLELPFEMRQAIYEAAILDDMEGVSFSDEKTAISTSISLLQTCRQVKQEAEPIRYQRPQSFTSQSKLFQWVDRSRRANLERVRTLVLHLTDVNVASMLTTDRSAWSLYQEDLVLLEEALHSLPKLSSLTIIPLEVNGIRHRREFYHLFLRIIPICCPKLKRLELQNTKDVLGDVPTLKLIREVVCTGHQHDYTEAGAEEVAGDTVAFLRMTMKFDSHFVSRRPTDILPLPRMMTRSRVTRAVSY